MPSSLTVNLSSALVYSTRPPVSVYGTGPQGLMQTARIFSGACSIAVIARPEGPAYFPVSPPCVSPAGHMATSVQRTIRSVRTRFASPSPPVLNLAGCRNIDRLSIRLTRTAGVRPRLTPGRLASPGNPWSYGGGVSLPACRYSCLHLLFRPLQRPSRDTFAGYRNAPLPTCYLSSMSHVFGTALMPDYYPCGAARPVSCYALFE